MNITELRDQIRSRRRVVEVSGSRWAVISTAGDYRHEITYNLAFQDFQCDTCMSRFGVNRCWARRRVLEFVQSTEAATATATT